MFFADYNLEPESLCKLWGEFMKTKQAYTPNERWSELINTNSKNSEFAVLTMDNIIYDFYRNNFNEESENTSIPYYYTTFMIVLAKKATIDYRVEMNIPAYEFTTYFESTRLTTLFERNKDYSEAPENFSKYQDRIIELFPNEEITLYKMFNEEDEVKKFETMCEDDKEYGLAFIDAFSNLLAYDFVKNYMKLPNTRVVDFIDNSTYEGESDCCEDECCPDSEVEWTYSDSECGDCGPCCN